ncbi:hypothetical protein [uncultured Planktosalinus sp.]|uniref:hypothetical protein n=1 Tax=uncultured Planktosalinus sp. TaxID=1810935 RepID=UPI0030D972C5
MEPKTIIITGMSGMKIKELLENFIANFSEFHRSHKDRTPILIKFDEIIEATYYEMKPEIHKSRLVWLDYILQESYPVLERLWNCSFDKVENIIKDIRSKEPSKTILINLHACYFHNKTQEYLSLVNLKKVSKINPTKIITLIDDIYEIHHRLTEVGGIYRDDNNVSKSLLILRLLRLLDWRATETTFSRYIAMQLGLKNYLFATKHSYLSFSNLIYEDYKKVYLSHPITEVRRLEKKGDSQEVEKIMSEINEISEKLSYQHTTFLPTTIDEYRIYFKIADEGDSKIYFEKLTERWDAKKYKDPKDILYNKSGFNDVNALWIKNIEDVSTDNTSMNTLLEVLSDLISDQVSIRDYALVEQSDILIIYRPLFNGNASGGVKEEFRYFKKLKVDTNRDILCFIYCPQIDIEKYYARQLVKLIEEEIQSNNLQYSGSESLFLSKECEELFNAKEDYLLTLDIFDRIMNENDIKVNVKNTNTPLSGNKSKEFKENFVKNYIEECHKGIHEYKNEATIFEQKQIPIGDFINKINSYLQQKQL